MNLKIGDSVLYLSQSLKEQHTGIILSINKDKYPNYPYNVHWINDQDTHEPEDAMHEYRKQYLETLGK